MHSRDSSASYSGYDKWRAFINPSNVVTGVNQESQEICGVEGGQVILGDLRG